MNNPGVHYNSLSLKSVHLEILNNDRNKVGVASGFIFREEDKLFLLTCWHVATGFDPNNLQVKTPPNRAAIRIHLMGARQPQPGIEALGGSQTIELELYDTSTTPATPKWLQDHSHKPHPDLNAININVPFWHDLIKLEIQDHGYISDVQVLEVKDVSEYGVRIGKKVLLVGYPYGYSPTTLESPTPVVLTRFVAAETVRPMNSASLLDGIGAAGMSGCPVFLENGDFLKLVGIYTGSIYPDHIIEKNNEVTALGKIDNISMALKMGSPLKLVSHENQVSYKTLFNIKEDGQADQ
jgi:hypothetical protein